MIIDNTITDDTLLQLIGERLSRLRLSKNLTQAQLAEQAGLSLRTVQRLERGEAATQLSGFVRVCRVLGLLERFDAFLPEPAASPIAQLAQLKRYGRQRKRATGRKRAIETTARQPQKKWTWGESS
jgi:transcriptional regulator with XRE-family HTH domain